MFDNIGGKLKGLAKFNFMSGCIAAVIILIFYPSINGESYIFPAILISIAFVIACMVASCLIYGFGELIEIHQETKRLLQDGLAENIRNEEERQREKELSQAKAEMKQQQEEAIQALWGNR